MRMFWVKQPAAPAPAKPKVTLAPVRSTPHERRQVVIDNLLRLALSGQLPFRE